MKQLKKKIVYVSGTRADLGLMAPVLGAIGKSKHLELELYVTGAHLMPEFGETLGAVTKEFPKAKRIEAIFPGDERGNAVSFGWKFLKELGSLFARRRPDLVLLLGDRPEMIYTALVCTYLSIPTAHIHGGERTRTVDEVVRHSITKLASIHFAATAEAVARIRKLGEDGWRIHLVGAPTLDVVAREQLPSREELFRTLGLNGAQKPILVTYHPVSEEYRKAGSQMAELLAAVKAFPIPVIVIYPNTDPGGRSIIAQIDKERRNPLFRIIPHVPHRQFLALIREAAVWVGNSSAMIIESPYFRIPTVLVGIRQEGRGDSRNIISVACRRQTIQAAIKKALSDTLWRRGLVNVRNVWGDGKAALRIVKVLENLQIDETLLRKQITY